MSKFLYYKEAIEKTRQGFAVTRLGWTNGEWLITMPGETLNTRVHKIQHKCIKKAAEERGGTIEILPFLVFRNKDGNIETGWLPSPLDEFVGDWYVKEEEKG